MTKETSKKKNGTQEGRIWAHKDLLALKDLSAREIELILDTAESFKEVSQRSIKKVPALRGKTIVNLFFEPSTRTRTSFELAAKRLSADTINISKSTSAAVKGESLLDTAKNIEAMNVDAIIIRHEAAGAPKILADAIAPAVINAGDGAHEHPTQGLLDLLTIRQKKGRIQGLEVGIVGDILHSRVARSDIWGLTKLGAKVTVCGPPPLIPAGIEEMGVKVTYDLSEIIRRVDVLITLRIQLERQKGSYFPSIREYARFFGIDNEKLQGAKPDILIMHPGPINRGVELSPDIADGKYSVILEQVANGVAARMAVLYLIVGAQSEEE
ncbi:MAG: aspartate carbamoyltransferase catalytic subunit [Candidatus Omnitrophica bacterium]|nr:aspartate carbamoyltransferase catalytic subunit [Candidatus Omnitrophota bacterium]